MAFPFTMPDGFMSDGMVHDAEGDKLGTCVEVCDQVRILVEMRQFGLTPLA